MNNNKTYAIVFGIFALVIVTTAASLAFFTYSRVGNTTTTITSGDIEFTYKEGESAGLANAFPVSDSVGAQDTTEEYTFTVNLKSSSTSNKMNYNVYLLDNNKQENINYFANQQIKFALIKDGTYVAGTTNDTGIKLSSLDGFDEDKTYGEGIVLENQEILAGKTDQYKLRIWISDDVKYTNTNPETGQDEQTSVGKYNGYKYSLKVKVTSGVAIAETGTIRNLKVDKLTMTVDLVDENGLSAYAVTESETAPETTSSEWIDLTTTAKSNVVRTSAVTSKSIEFMVKKNGTHYLHVKNGNNEVVTKSFTTNVTGENAVQKIIGLAETNTNELRIDEHEPTGQQNFATKEYRYWGATPNNYVWFNNELWRIIGVMDVDDGSNAEKIGKIEERLKIIRNESIGKYSWDSSVSEINNGWGVNEWSQADLMTLLNSGAYYNRTTGTCYNAENNATKSCDFTTTGLTIEAKEMIGNAKWYLGSYSSNDEGANIMYSYERGESSSKQCQFDDSYCSDIIERTSLWIGKLGLIYPSDYGYSSTYECSTTKMNNSSFSGTCDKFSWLYDENRNYWALSPAFANSYFGDDRATLVYFINQYGYLFADNARTRKMIFPTTYLLPSIKILDGEGTVERPFVLSK